MERFKKLIEGELAQHQPGADYSRADDLTVVVAFVVFRAAGRECVTQIIDRPDVDWRRTVRRAQRLFDTALSPCTLTELAKADADSHLLALVVRLRAETGLVAVEITRRLLGHEMAKSLGLHLVLLQGGGPLGDEAFAALLRALRVKNLSSYRPGIESSGDLQGLAVEKAWEAYRAVQAKVAQEIPQGSLLPIPSDADHTYARNAALFDHQFRAGLKLFLPAFRSEHLRERARQALRDHFAAQTAQKRDYKKLVSLEEVRARPSESPQEVPGWRLDGLRAYEAAHRRWGSRGARFVEALLQDQTVEEASKAAGVSRQTGHKYLKFLRRQTKS